MPITTALAQGNVLLQKVKEMQQLERASISKICACTQLPCQYELRALHTKQHHIPPAAQHWHSVRCAEAAVLKLPPICYLYSISCPDVKKTVCTLSI